jgi:hypothetical protein
MASANLSPSGPTRGKPPEGTPHPMPAFLLAAVRAFAALVGPREIAGLAGLSLFTEGARMVYPPLGFLVPGAALVYLALKA